MIELLSLFLGLVSGVATVELRAYEPVVEVELQLDGRSLGTVSGPPWSLECDLGELQPHELVAIGRDRNGAEVETTRRWINVGVAADREWGRGRQAADLLPVAVRLESEPGVAEPDGLGSSFLAAGDPVAVARIESGPAEVVILRDPAAQPALDRIVAAVADREDQGSLGLEPGVEVRFLSPAAAPASQVESRRELFAVMQRPGEGGGPFLELVAAPGKATAFRLADAIALAAAELHASGRRRAIVIILEAVRRDESIFSPDEVRRYLMQLQVPLFVWSVASSRWHPDWGEVHFLHPRRAGESWDEAIEALRTELAAQRIAWVEGRHLPQSITLGTAARGARLAGESGGRRGGRLR